MEVVTARAGLLCVLLGTAPLGAVEEDSLSFEERLLEDGDDPPERPEFFETRLRMREVRPPGSTHAAAPPELQHNLYFLGRVRAGRGPIEIGLLAKRAAVGPALSWENLADRGVLKAVVAVGREGDPFRALAGNFRHAFGQGLLMYDGFGEFVRPLEVRDRGPRPDYSSGLNDHLQGAAVRWTTGRWSLDGLASDKPLDFPLNPDGSVDGNLDDLHETTGDVQTAAGLANDDSVRERVVGGRARWGTAGSGVAVNGLSIDYSRAFDPVDRDYADARAFRGNRIRLGSIDARWEGADAVFFGEAARSQTDRGLDGTAWIAGGWTGPAARRFWACVFDYDPDFVSPHGKALAFSVSGAPQNLPRNQRGAAVGAEGTAGPWRGRAQLTTARFPAAVGDGADSGALFPSQGRYFLCDQWWDAGGGKLLRLSYQERDEEKREDGSGPAQTVREKTQRARMGLQWKASPRWTWGLRRDVRWEKTPALGARHRGSLWAVDTVVAPDRKTSIKARMYVFDSPAAFLTTGPEEIWDGVVYDRLAGNAGRLRGRPGTRLTVIARRDWGGLRLWAKWETTRRSADAEGRAGDGDPPRRAWHLQMETRWGRNL